MSTTSPLASANVITLFFDDSYKQEITRDLHWFASYANHYWQAGGVGTVLAAMQIVPMALLFCPVANVITYVAMSYIFQGKSNELCKAAMEEKNALGAYVLTERGANVDQKNSAGQTLLDLFALKGEEQKEFTAQDLRICETLFRKDVTANFSKKGFQMMLDSAIENNHQALALFLIANEVNPSESWNAYLSKTVEDGMEVPAWVKVPLYGFDNVPFKLKNLSVAACESTLKKFSEKDNPSFQLERIFGQSTNNCPLVLGDSQVERDSLVHHLARKIIEDNVPSILKGKRIIELDLKDLQARYNITDNLLKAGAELKAMTDALQNSPDVILYVHGYDIFEKTNLSHSYIQPAIANWAKNGQVIFSMQAGIYERHATKEETLQKAVTAVKVTRPSKTETLPLMHSMKLKLENQHSVTFANSAVDAAIEMTHYLPHGKLPQTPYELLDAAATLIQEQEYNGSIALQTAIEEQRKISFDLQLFRLKNGSASQKHVQRLEKELEEKSAEIKELQAQDEREKVQKRQYQELLAKRSFLQNRDPSLKEAVETLIKDIDKQLATYECMKRESNIKFEVDRDLVAAVVSTRSGIPLDRVHGADREKLISLEKTLGAEVIGQPQAVRVIANTLQAARLGLRDEKKPRGVFLCAGTSGTGKTEMAKSIARNMFGDEKNMTRLDMSEFQEKESKSRLIGPPPGYVGYSEGGQLTEALKRNPYQVILIDEVEKAAPSVLTTFLQVFSDGRLTDGQGNTVDCSQAVFVMTTNIGAREITKSQTDCYYLSTRPTPEQVIHAVLGQSEHFTDELLGRLEIVPFNPITNQEDIKAIIRKTLTHHQKLVMDKKGIELNWTDAFVDQLAIGGASTRFGVRPLVKKIEDLVLNTLAKKELDGSLKEGSSIEFDYNLGNQSYEFKIN